MHSTWPSQCLWHLARQGRSHRLISPQGGRTRLPRFSGRQAIWPAVAVVSLARLSTGQALAINHPLRNVSLKGPAEVFRRIADLNIAGNCPPLTYTSQYGGER